MTAGHDTSSGRAPAAPAPPGAGDAAAAFAVTFGIAFALAYTALERLNWPLFTYHPVSGALQFGRHAEGVGPPMFWYGWIVLAAAVALAAAFAAARVPRSWRYRATVFACALAVLWPSALAAVRVFVTSFARFDASVLDNAWIAGLPALAGALAVTALWMRTGARLLAQAGAGLLVLVPLGGLVVLGWSLLPYFLR